MSDEEFPATIPCGSVRRGNILLSHALWCPVSEFGRSEQPETGVRNLDIPGHFELMQHGCRNWNAVTETTFRALAKGWDTGRITDFIRNISDRKRRARFA